MALNGTCKHFDWYLVRGFSKRVVCSCKAKHFFKVTFDPDTLPYNRKLKTEVIFGFCDNHVSQHQTISGYAAKKTKHQPDWVNGYSVHGQYGVVTSVFKIQLSKADLEQARARELLASFKSQFWRILHQENAARITPEMWKELFEEIYRELAVEDTMTG